MRRATTQEPRPGKVPGGSELRRTLGFRDLVVYGLLFIAPMAPVGVFGTLDAKSGGAVALVYAVATLAMAFTAVSYAQLHASVVGWFVVRRQDGPRTGCGICWCRCWARAC